MTTTQFGVHYMLDGYDADHDSLGNKQLLERLLNDIPLQMNMHTISEPVVVEVGEKNSKDPGGISGFVMIAESHISFHTFPKRGFITVDVYTCQNDLNTDMLTDLFTQALSINDHEVTIIPRGTRYPATNRI